MANYAIFRIEKIKSGSEVMALLHEMLPDENNKKRTSPRADEKRSAENTNSGTVTKSFETYSKLKPEKIRKNAVVGLSLVVGTSEEFRDRTTEEKYYEDARTHIEKYFGKIVGWSIHRDETSTHMQVITIPLDENNKLNAKKLIGGSSKRMSEIQTNFYNEVGKNYDLERGKIDSKAVHKTVEECHREKQKELDEREKNLNKQMQKIESTKDMLRTQKDKLGELIKTVEDCGMSVLDCSEKNKKKEIELNEREKNLNEREDKLKKAETEFNEKHDFYQLNENLWDNNRNLINENFENFKKKKTIQALEKAKENCIKIFDRMREIILDLKYRLGIYENKTIGEFINDLVNAKNMGFKTYGEYLKSQRTESNSAEQTNTDSETKTKTNKR